VFLDNRSGEDKSCDNRDDYATTSEHLSSDMRFYVPYWGKLECPIFSIQPQHKFGEAVLQSMTVENMHHAPADDGSASASGSRGGTVIADVEGRRRQRQRRQWWQGQRQKSPIGWLNRCKALVEAVLSRDDVEAMRIAQEYKSYPSMEPLIWKGATRARYRW